MKKYIEKYGKDLVRKALLSKQNYTRVYSGLTNRRRGRFYVSREKEDSGLRIFSFQVYRPQKFLWISVYVQKIGTKYTVTDCGYSAARYLEKKIADGNESTTLSAISLINTPSNKLVKAICECAIKSYKLATTGK